MERSIFEGKCPNSSLYLNSIAAYETRTTFLPALLGMKDFPSGGKHASNWLQISVAVGIQLGFSTSLNTSKRNCPLLVCRSTLSFFISFSTLVNG